MTAAHDDGSLPLGADVVVVGAGVLGLAVAAELATAGADVLVLDRATRDDAEPPAVRCSLSDAVTWPALALLRRSLELWRAAEDEVRAGVDDVAGGGLVVARPDELARLSARVAAQVAAGVAAVLLDEDTVRAVAPGLGRGVAGGALYGDDARVDVRCVHKGLLRRLERHGGTVVRAGEVTGAELDGDGDVERLLTDRGPLLVGSTVVDAAGAGSTELCARLGGELALEIARTHILRTVPGPTVADRATVAFGTVAARDPASGEWTVRPTVVPAGDGRTVLGASHELAGVSRHVNPAVVSAIATHAVELFPALGAVRVERTTLAFPAAAPDGVPVIGWDPEVGGLLHVTGFGVDEVACAPAAAEAACAHVFGAAAAFDLEPFSPRRLARRGVA